MKNSQRLTLLIALSCLSFAAPTRSQASGEPHASSATTSTALWGDYPDDRPSCVRGVHVTAWYVGTKKGRAHLEKILAETEINAVVIDIKESEGDVYIPGVTLDGRPNYVKAVPDLKEYIQYLKDRGAYVIARQTIFHDEKLAHWKPDWAVKSSTPLAKAQEKGFRRDVWVDRKGSAWADEYNPEVWKYNIQIAEKAVDLGFQEIQFDYIRFPSDGPTRLCVYSKPHNEATAVKALSDFLEQTHQALKARGVPFSIDVFGLTGSSNGDMGIGQKLDQLIKHVDIICPMMYPSHYAPGEYGLKNPNASPYETLDRSIRDTKRLIGKSSVELRPWLQDFSLGIRYDAKHVRDQIDAAADHGVNEWLLWNPMCRYTRDALDPPPNEQERAEESQEKTREPAPEANKTSERKASKKI